MVQSPKITGHDGKLDLDIPETSGTPHVTDAPVLPQRRPGRLKGELWMADDFAMLAAQLALVAAALFSGAAFYVNAVEQPARLILDDRALLTEWQPAYKRGTLMQAPLAVIAFVLGSVAWWQAGHPGLIFGALFMIANLPVTFLVIMPVNHKLEAIEPGAAGPDSRALIVKWGSLHAIRTALGFAAVLAFLWATLA